MSINFETGSSLSQKIAFALKIKILMGEYKPGQQIDTVRGLAYELSVNPNTVQKALTLLEKDSLLISKGTIGRFVTEDSSVLDNALKDYRNSFMESVIEKATEIGITKETFINYLKERGE